MFVHIIKFDFMSAYWPDSFITCHVFVWLNIDAWVHCYNYSRLFAFRKMSLHGPIIYFVVHQMLMFFYFGPPYFLLLTCIFVWCPLCKQSQWYRLDRMPSPGVLEVRNLTNFTISGSIKNDWYNSVMCFQIHIILWSANALSNDSELYF